MAHLNIKLLTYVGLTLISLIFYIAGVSSSVFESKSNAGYTVTLFTVCPKASNTVRGCYNVQWSGCKALHNARNAAAAFEILAILTSVAALVIGCVELFREPIDVKLFGILRVRTIVSIVAWLFALFGWAIAVSLFTAPHCGQPAISKDASARMGANQPLFIVGWLFMLVSFFTSCLPFSGEILVKSSTSAPH